tara:strand:- start:282 stop:422 length:141 start_codon:yes stop_codon:yes gene_type:complete
VLADIMVIQLEDQMVTQVITEVPVAEVHNLGSQLEELQEDQETYLQ